MNLSATIKNLRLFPSFCIESLMKKELGRGYPERRGRQYHAPEARVMRDLRDKTRTTNNLSLVVRAQRQIKNCDWRGEQEWRIMLGRSGHAPRLRLEQRAQSPTDDRVIVDHENPVGSRCWRRRCCCLVCHRVRLQR